MVLPLASLLALALFAPQPAAAKPSIPVRVDARVELMSIVFRLAGADEYNAKLAESDYSDEVDEWFAPVREHAAVARARQLRAQNGISHDAVASFAVHLTDDGKLGERVPFDAKPERLMDRWPVDAAKEFLVDLQAFARDSKFDDFFAAHRDLYAKTEARMDELLGRKLDGAWFARFFGGREGATFVVTPGLLIGPNNFGLGVRFTDGRPEEIHPVIGVWERDAEGLPRFPDGVLPTIVHEFCHSYVNPLVDAHLAALVPPGSVLMPPVEAIMRRQAYLSWRTVLHESLVRASVVHYLTVNDGAAAAAKQAEDDASRGFTWVGDLAKKLDAYDSDRKKWPTLDAFMPEVVEFFVARAAQFERAAASAPKIVSMIPANGATDVDPALAAIVITFDRSMKTQQFSVLGGGEEFPKLAGKAGFDPSGKVFTMPVALSPGHTYRFGLNGGQHQNFQARDGTPLVAVNVEFRTSGK